MLLHSNMDVKDYHMLFIGFSGAALHDPHVAILLILHGDCSMVQVLGQSWELADLDSNSVARMCSKSTPWFLNWTMGLARIFLEDRLAHVRSVATKGWEGREEWTLKVVPMCHKHTRQAKEPSNSKGSNTNKDPLAANEQTSAANRERTGKSGSGQVTEASAWASMVPKIQLEQPK
ncbi:hypothetical protein CBOM_03705 [Ceraceosorus bombacis]|uniref:Uncharacterized protein n=1 Tax=Ceraceosorus bombacis TaxID=401625 RepID=A0A0P1BGW0_9BASI|nr:hypothetical protein CBOM_03705 [Ceraceosorus bombacis]